MTQTTHANILILGAGMGGFETFYQLKKSLKKYKRSEKIMLVDKEPEFTYVPLLHEMAFNAVQAKNISIPGDEIVRGSNHEFWQNNIEKIDVDNKKVFTDKQVISYDFCVIALGSRINYFNTPGAETYAYNVRSLAGATALREKIMSMTETTPVDIVIVGGGATGVEVAGQCIDLRQRLQKENPTNPSISISLVHKNEALTCTRDANLQNIAKNRLIEKSVSLFFGRSAAAIHPNQVLLDDGKILPSSITIWTAGFENVGDCHLDKSLCKEGRVMVETHLALPNYPHTYAIGDMAICSDSKKTAYQQSAQVACQQGKFVAKEIISQLINGKRLETEFKFVYRGTLTPIDARFGLAEVGKIKFTGFGAWLLKSFVHLQSFHNNKKRALILRDLLKSHIIQK